MNFIERNWKLIVLGLIAGVLLFLVIRLFTPQAEATVIPKVDICHYDGQSGNFQTLNIAQVAANVHLALHDQDYSGACEEPEDVCENLEGVQEETPEGYKNEDGYCYIPEQEECPPGTHEAAYEERWEELVCVPDEVVCTENCGTPATFQGSTTEAPVCPNGDTSEVVANPHVLRNGVQATVNFFITEGDSANIYWKEVSAPDWQHAMSDVKPNSENFVSVTIGGLDANLGYTFGIEQKTGCGGGQRTAVVVDDPTPTLFRLSYWE